MEKKRNLEFFIVALSQLKGIGRTRIKNVLEAMNAPRECSLFDLIVAGVKQNIFSRSMPIGAFEDALKKAERIFKQCEENDIHILSAYAPEFPKALNFDNGPQLIYYKGDLSILNEPKRAAVIGTRVPSEAGDAFAFECGRLLAENDFTVISGLAAGCDTAAHRGCIQAAGKTVAFLPCNLINITPAAQAPLAEDILQAGGCLISEYSPFDTPSAYMFIERDRLQAGSAQFVITSEFDKGSGTLHTLTFADRYARPIYTLDAIAQNEAIDGFRSLEDEGIAYQALSKVAMEALIQAEK